jgi:predicted NBD/HSP70 family sugar kinase/biotin operon repressor
VKDAGSLATLRELNRLRVVDELRRHGTASRSDLARLTGLSRTTVTAVVGELQARGFVVDVEEGAALPGRGRPPVMLRLDPSAGLALGVDFGHSHVRVAVADLSSTVLAERRIDLDVDANAAASLDAAADLVGQVLADAGADAATVVGAGMGVPGPFDRRTGRVSTTMLLPSWQGLSPGEELSRRIGVHVEVDNDANMGALGEAIFGAGRGVADMAYVKVATGIGGGLVLDGRLYRGASGIAGELGHIGVVPEGPVCICGGRGCLQSVAAVPQVLAALRAAHGPELTVAGMLELAAAGDVAAVRVINDAGRAIGRVLADLCNHVNPSAIVVGGDLSGAREPLLAGIRASIDRYALRGAAETVEVKSGVLGDRAEVLGAIALVVTDTERLRSAGLAVLAGGAVVPS